MGVVLLNGDVCKTRLMTQILKGEITQILETDFNGLGKDKRGFLIGVILFIQSV
jgi:hypothetical protein